MSFHWPLLCLLQHRIPSVCRIPTGILYLAVLSGLSEISKINRLTGHHYNFYIFIRPSSDGTNYGMVMSARPSVRPPVRPFSALFSYMLWHNELKFCTWLCFNVLQIKFECRHFASIFEGVMPSDSPSGSPSARFPHFSHTCFDILSWNFAHDFVLMYYRSSLSVVTLRQFLKELCLFVNLEYR